MIDLGPTDLPVLYNRDDVLAIARLAEQSEQYDDMIKILKPYIESKDDEDLDFEGSPGRPLLHVSETVCCPAAR